MSLSRIWEPLQIGIVCLLGYLLGSSITALFNNETAAVGGLWAAISGLVVHQATTKDTWQAASVRVLGSFLGAAIATIYLLILPFNVVGMAIVVALTFFICSMLGAPAHGRLGAITVVVIMVIAHENPNLSPITNAILRCIETIIGTAIALLAVLVFPAAKPTPPAPN